MVGCGAGIFVLEVLVAGWLVCGFVVARVFFSSSSASASRPPSPRSHPVLMRSTGALADGYRAGQDACRQAGLLRICLGLLDTAAAVAAPAAPAPAALDGDDVDGAALGAALPQWLCLATGKCCVGFPSHCRCCRSAPSPPLPPLPLAVFSTGMERGCQHFNSTGMS